MAAGLTGDWLTVLTQGDDKVLKQVVLVASLMVSGAALAVNADGWVSVDALPVDADGWISLGVNNTTGTQISLNTARIKVIDSKRRIISYWSKMTQISPPTAVSAAFGLEIGDSMVSNDLARCSDEMDKTISIMVFNKDKVLLRSMQTKIEDTEWSNPLPNSNAEEGLRIMCWLKYSKAKSKKKTDGM